MTFPVFHEWLDEDLNSAYITYQDNGQATITWTEFE